MNRWWLLVQLSVAWVLIAVGIAACSDTHDPSGSLRSTTTSTSARTGESSTTTTSTRTGESSTTTTPASASARFAEDVCRDRVNVTDVGQIDTGQITEASGIVASRINPGIWWITNDSGDSARIFAVDEAGRLRAILEISGAKAVDWEDLAIEGNTIYVADTGDGRSRRKTVTVYSVDEPTLPRHDGATTREVEPVTLRTVARSLRLTYPDGPHDVEALAFDPLQRELFVFTKDWSLRGVSGIYRTPAPAPGERSASRRFERVGELRHSPGTLVTGADISPDGSLIVVRSYTSIEVFRRSDDKSVVDALKSDSCGAPLPAELQGESVGFTAGGDGYMTISEGSRQKLHLTHG